MGYTHYWKNKREFTEEQWTALRIATESILRNAIAAGIKLQYEFDDQSSPLVGQHEIRFNGAGDDGCETFLLERVVEDFAFCKTRRLHYDAAVVAVLIEAARLNDAFEWTSDGGDEEGYTDEARKLIPRRK